MQKRISLLLILAVLTPMLNGFSPPSPGPTVVVDGESSVAAVRWKGVPYAPLEELARALGAKIYHWEPKLSLAKAEAPGLTVKVAAGDIYLTANDRLLYMRDGCLLRRGAPWVPVHVLARAFGAVIQEDAAARQLRLTTTGEPIACGQDFYSEEDVYWLSRLIYAEAGSDCMDGMIAVGNVVLNRVADRTFPDTVEGVIFDRRVCIQFTPAYSKAIHRTPPESCVVAAKLALEGVDIVGDCLYFASAAIAETCWAGRNREFVAMVGGQAFFL